MRRRIACMGTACDRDTYGRLVCSVLVNSDILTANYGVKQIQFTKPTSEPPR